jgi:hypothetical protein
MITTLLITLAVIAVLSGYALVMAWKQAVDGHEDEHGFVAAPADRMPVTIASRNQVGAQLPQAV